VVRLANPGIHAIPCGHASEQVLIVGPLMRAASLLPHRQASPDERPPLEHQPCLLFGPAGT
jgi:hypothetical protein